MESWGFSLNCSELQLHRDLKSYAMNTVHRFLLPLCDKILHFRHTHAEPANILYTFPSFWFYPLNLLCRSVPAFQWGSLNLLKYSKPKPSFSGCTVSSNRNIHGRTSVRAQLRHFNMKFSVEQHVTWSLVWLWKLDTKTPGEVITDLGEVSTFTSTSCRYILATSSPCTEPNVYNVSALI